jgi:hypothetical protein
MAVQKNYRELTFPAKWVSAYQPLRFTFDTPTETAFLYEDNDLLSIQSGVFRNSDTLLKKGDLVYLTTGAYKGYHVVNSIISYDYIFGNPVQVYFRTETPFGLPGFITEVKYLQPQEWQVVKIGTPDTLLANFQIEGNKDGFLECNVSGYVQGGLSEIVPPIQGTNLSGGLTGIFFQGVDPNLSISFRIVYSGTNGQWIYALNAGIDSNLLFNKYVSTRQFLGNELFKSGCGSSFFTYIQGVVITTVRFVGDAALPRRAFNDRFNSRFLKT